MNTKPVLIVLAALLLVQCSFGKPTRENISKESSEESKENDNSSDDSLSAESKEEIVMTNMIMTELTVLVDFSLTAGKTLLKDVLGDLKAMEVKSDRIQTKIEEFSKVNAELDKIDLTKRNQLGRKLVLLIDLDNLLDINTETDKLSKEDSFVQNSLKTHGIETIEKEFEEKFLYICEECYEAANNYLNSLSPEEQKEKERLSEWRRRLSEKKMELFGDSFVSK